MWLEALRSYFNARNHPFAETEQTSILTRDWSDELVIARQTLLRISQLALRVLHLKDEKGSASKSSDQEMLLADLEDEDAIQRDVIGPTTLPLIDLAEAVNDLGVIAENLQGGRQFSFYAWSTLGKLVTREINRAEIAHQLERSSRRDSPKRLPATLLDLTGSLNSSDSLSSDITRVFSYLTRLLERLRMVEVSLRRDHPLKQTLPIFCLVHEEARSLLDFIESRALRTEGLDTNVFDALDGMNYAIAMELRKVFLRELVGFSSFRQSPPIYAKVENAHGLLRDCFQQSIVGLAQVFDPTLDGSRLFSTFKTKLEQSLVLRNDLWQLLQLVRRAEKERDHHPISRVLERLNSFRDGSLRYLMYKDWEACERFMEEAAAARGVVEVTPVLHRFGAYLETLHGQVSMRAVLADQPFDYPPLEA